MTEKVYVLNISNGWGVDPTTLIFSELCKLDEKVISMFRGEVYEKFSKKEIHAERIDVDGGSNWKLIYTMETEENVENNQIIVNYTRKYKSATSHTYLGKDILMLVPLLGVKTNELSGEHDYICSICRKSAISSFTESVPGGICMYGFCDEHTKIVEEFGIEKAFEDKK